MPRDHSFVGSAHTVETDSLRLNCRGEWSDGKEGSVRIGKRGSFSLKKAIGVDVYQISPPRKFSSWGFLTLGQQDAEKLVPAHKADASLFELYEGSTLLSRCTHYRRSVRYHLLALMALAFSAPRHALSNPSTQITSTLQASGSSSSQDVEAPLEVLYGHAQIEELPSSSAFWVD